MGSRVCSIILGYASAETASLKSSFTPSNKLGNLLRNVRVTGRHTIVLSRRDTRTALIASPIKIFCQRSTRSSDFCSSRRECRFSLRRRFEDSRVLSMSLLSGSWILHTSTRTSCVYVCAVVSSRFACLTQLGHRVPSARRIRDLHGPCQAPSFGKITVHIRTARMESKASSSSRSGKRAQVPPLIKNSAN